MTKAHLRFSTEIVRRLAWNPAEFVHDVALDGPDSFENWALGAELSSKLFVTTESGGPSFLLSARYLYQDYFQLDETEHQFMFRVTMGF